MKRLSWNLPAACAAAALLTVALFSGCETVDEDDYAGIRVSPTYASLRRGQSVTLTASGGWNYRWALDNTEHGTLNATYGESVTYTAHTMPSGTDVQVTVTVTGRVSNYGTNGIYAAEARINHRASPAEEEP